VEGQISRLEAEWEEIKNQRNERKQKDSDPRLSHRLSGKYNSTPYVNRYDASDVKYARIDLTGRAQPKLVSASHMMSQQSHQLDSP